MPQAYHAPAGTAAMAARPRPPPAGPVPPSAAVVEALAAAHAALERGEAGVARAAARAARRQVWADAAGLHWLGRACVYEAVAAQIQFDYPAAFERALEALAFLDETDVAMRTRALNSCFVVCAESGDLDRALDYSRQAIELAEAGGDRSGAARALHNRAALLAHLQQFEAARHCTQEAIARYDALPQEAAYAWFSRVSLAVHCLSHARLLADAGQSAAAQDLRRLAALVVPPLRPAAGAAPHAAELTALDTWIAVQAELGQLDGARQGLRQYLRLVRLGGRVSRFQAYALRALAAYHFHAGRVERGLRLQQAAAARLASGGNRLYQLTAQHRLVQMLASAGRHGEAVQALRAAQALRARLDLEQAAMRDRLAALERQVRERVARQQEARAHQQRLAVIGRLLADIHLALDRPLTGLHAALLRCAGTAPPLPGQLLPEVIEHIDAAAGLVRQLKMFSYRSAPQPTVVDLRGAVREAWAGIAGWRRMPATGLDIAGAAQVRVRADGQRLAVLLRILLMEADRSGAGGAPQVRLERDGAVGCMELSCTAAGPQADVGLALCREIAQEMGGELRDHVGPQWPGFVLQLPGV